MKSPVPSPSEVLLSVTVGVVPVLQQTPRAVTEELPADATVPPLVAEICVIIVAVAVVTEGAIWGSSFLQLPIERSVNPTRMDGRTLSML